MDRNNILNRFFFLLISFLELFSLKANNYTPSFGLTFGYLNTELSEINGILYTQDFKTISKSINNKYIINEFGDTISISSYSIIPSIYLSYRSKSFVNSRLYYEISLGYQHLKRQSKEYRSIVGEYKPILIDENGRHDLNIYQMYEYGFKLNLYSTTIITYLDIIRKEKIHIGLGAGLISTFEALRQSGIMVKQLPNTISYSNVKVKTREFNIDFIASAQISYLITKKISINYSFRYSFQNEINTNKQALYTDSETGSYDREYFVPLRKTQMTEPKFNLKGLYYLIGVFYKWN